MRALHIRLVEVVEHYRTDAMARSQHIHPIRERHLQHLMAMAQSTKSDTMLLARVQVFMHQMTGHGVWYTLWLRSEKGLLYHYLDVLTHEYDLERQREVVRNDQERLRAMIAQNKHEIEQKIEQRVQQIVAHHQHQLDQKNHEISRLSLLLKQSNKDNQMLKDSYEALLHQVLSHKERQLNVHNHDQVHRHFNKMTDESTTTTTTIKVISP